MKVPAIISATKTPVTLPQLAADLQGIGIQAGMVVLCHSSLSALGWVNGGAQTVILALEQALGKRGTLVMPTQTWGLSNPSLWCNPPVPEAWWEAICATMPAFDPDLSPCREMGIIPDTFRKQPGSRRSHHPQHSFAARGPKARWITRKHSLDFGLGDQSPLGRLYSLDASILLLGCGWKNCTALHLAEHRGSWSWKTELAEFSPIKRLGWIKMRNWNISDEDFEQCGQAFAIDQPSNVISARIGNANCTLIKMRPLVDFAQAWFHDNRASSVQQSL